MHKIQNLSQRITQLSPSPTMALDAKAKAMIQSGIPVINLTAGEPDFQTPTVIKKAAIKAIQDGFSYYTAPDGILVLREAIQKKFLHENGIKYALEEIIVGAGSKQLLYAAFQTLCSQGDEVIIPIPTWPTYIEQVKLADATPVLLPLHPPFKLKASDVEKKLISKTKILILNSPANPTGAMIDASELKKIASLAVKHGFYIIADEIYEKLIYDQKHTSIASLNDKIKNQTITINGVSKAYAMTGWRIGYAGGPKEIILAMKALQSQIISNAVSISQMAALSALTSETKDVEKMRSEFERRRNAGLRQLKKIPQVEIVTPEGAFYFFISIEKLLGEKYKTASEWCAALLEKELVALVPGEAFAYPGYVRMSYAASMDKILAAIEKINIFIKTS